MKTLYLLVLTASILLASPTAWALDIGYIEVLWLTDSVDGALAFDPFEMEMTVGLVDSAGVGAVEFVSSGSAGTVELTADGSEWGIDSGGTFANSAALFTAFPSGGSYTVNILDAPSSGGGSVLDSFSITLSPIEVMDIIDIQSPLHGATVPVGQSFSWANCSTCDGSRITGFLVDTLADSDVDAFTTTDMSTTSWTPTGMVGGTNYEFEVLLGEYSHMLTAETSDLLSDGFTFVAGYENINLVNITTVPEPGTASLLALGLTSLGLARRRSAGSR